MLNNSFSHFFIAFVSQNRSKVCCALHLCARQEANDFKYSVVVEDEHRTLTQFSCASKESWCSGHLGNLDEV